MYFKLHRQLGNNSVELTANVFRMKRATVASWLTNKDYINTWIHLVPEITFAEVIESIPIDSPYFNRYNNVKESLFNKKEFDKSLTII